MEIRNLKTSALAIGSTSVLALIASASQSAAEGLYMGFSIGTNSGSNPSVGYSSNPEDYDMGGAAISGFIGIQHDTGNDMFAGIELAYTGPTEGDTNNESSYDYAYDTNFTLDAKARFGKHMGSVDVYGIAGLTTGQTNGLYYGNDYKFWGVNVGAGAQMDLSEKMFAGVEYIHRFTEGVADAEHYTSSYGTLSLRLGYKF